MSRFGREPPDDTTIPQASARSSLLVRSVSLRVLVGPDAGRTVRVETPSFIIGCGAEADLRLSDPAVSRSHVSLRLAAGGVELVDLGSKNGTWMHGQRIKELLAVSDVVVTLGGSTLQLVFDASPRALPLSEKDHFGAAIGCSLNMRHVFELLERAAQSDVSVLLEGESGVGKEILAREIHAHSARAEGSFVVFDCGAVPPNLIESELFGHERGAFTGALDARRGVFEQAHRGTLFLDEIGELDPALQPKLLRVLEQREVRPVGGSVARQIDVRIVAATNRRLTEAVNKGEFRADLFYRIAVARVVVPPLRERRDDIAPVALSFLRQAVRDADAALPHDLEALLVSYAWPGNVRELRNVIQRFAFLGVRDARALFDGQHGTALAAGATEAAILPYDIARQRAIEDFEARYVPMVLERAAGSAAKAAQLAGVARQSFYRMMQRVRAQGDELADE